MFSLCLLTAIAGANSWPRGICKPIDNGSGKAYVVQDVIAQLNECMNNSAPVQLEAQFKNAIPMRSPSCNAVLLEMIPRGCPSPYLIIPNE